MQSAEQARAALDALEAEQYEDPPPHRAVLLPRLIMDARVAVAETELDAVDTELQELEAGDEARREALAATAADLRRARDAREAAREDDSAARQRMAHIRAGIKPYRQNVLDQLTNQG